MRDANEHRAADSAGQEPGHDAGHRAGHKAIVHIDMDTFFCSVERLFDPGLAGVPVIVGGTPGQRGVVAACSYEAREFGVHSAMPLSQAGKLCPDAVYLKGNFKAYASYSKAVRAILEEYTPVFEHAGIDESYLDLTGSRLALGAPAETVNRIRSRIKEELGLPCSAGLSTSKIVSKVASAAIKPDGFLEVRPGEEREFLAPLPVGKLPGVGPATRAALYDLGVRTVADLALFSADTLESVLGTPGRTLRDHARGIDPRRLERVRAPKSISRERTYATDTIDYEMVHSTLLLLCEKCCHALREESLAASRITIKLRYSDFRTLSRSVTLAMPTDQDQSVYATASGMLDGLLDKGGRIRLIGAALSSFSPGGCQGELFSLPGQAGDALRRDSLNESVDRIRNRYGFSSIVRGSTVPLLSRNRSGVEKGHAGFLPRNEMERVAAPVVKGPGHTDDNPR